MIEIRNVYPEIDGGKYPVKREIDRPLEVYADIFSDVPVKVYLKYRNTETWKNGSSRRA